MGESSVIRGATNEEVGSEIKFAGNDNKDKMYEPKHKRKLVRVLTVLGYVLSVSLAAIMLSLFYLFIYNPWKPAGGDDKALSPGAPRRSAPKLTFQKALEESSNVTFFETDKDEPRALPLQESKTTFLKRNKKSSLSRTTETETNGPLIREKMVKTERTDLRSPKFFKIIKY